MHRTIGSCGSIADVETDTGIASADAVALPAFVMFGQNPEIVSGILLPEKPKGDREVTPTNVEILVVGNGYSIFAAHQSQFPLTGVLRELGALGSLAVMVSRCIAPMLFKTVMRHA